GSPLHLSLEILDQPEKLVLRQRPGREGTSCLLVDALDVGDVAQTKADVTDRLHDGLRVDAVRRVVRDLDLAAAIRLVYRGSHRRGDAAGAHAHPTPAMARRPADPPDQPALR